MAVKHSPMLFSLFLVVFVTLLYCDRGFLERCKTNQLYQYNYYYEAHIIQPTVLDVSKTNAGTNM